MAFKNAKEMSISKSDGQAGNNFRSGPEFFNFLGGRLPLPESTSSKNFVGEITVLPIQLTHSQGYQENPQFMIGWLDIVKDVLQTFH